MENKMWGMSLDTRFVVWVGAATFLFAIMVADFDVRGFGVGSIAAMGGALSFTMSAFANRMQKN